MRKGCAAGHLEIAIWSQFLTLEPHFVRKGCGGHAEIAILPQFLTIEPHFVRKGAWDTSNRNFTAVFGDRTSFRAKGLRGTTWTRTFTSVFDDRTSFRAKRLRGTPSNRNFTSVFGDRTSFRAQRLRGTPSNRNFTSFFGDRTWFRAKGLRFVPSRWHCPCPRLQKRNRKEGEGKRGQEEKMWRCEDVKVWWRCEDVRMRRCEEEGKRARGQEGKRRRCEDVRMWRCEDVRMWGWEDVKMSRCEDVKMWRWADVKMSRCEDEQMWRWADVKMRRCEDEKMWRWEDVKMRRCEDEKMWSEKMWRWEDVKWEDVKMWRWETDPHYWKNPALRRSREKPPGWMEIPEGGLPYMQKPWLSHKGVLAEIEGLGFPGSSPKLWFLHFWAQNCGSKGGPLFWDPEKQFLSRSLLLKLIRFDWMSFSWKIGHSSWSQKLSPLCRCTTCSMLSVFSFNLPGIKLFSKKAHVGTFKEGTAFRGSDLGLKECCKWILALSKLKGKCWVPEVLISAWYPLCQSKTTCAHDVPS